MGCLRFYFQVALAALRHSLDAAQAIVFALLIVLGLAASQLPPMLRALVPNASGWEVAALALGGILTVRLILAPYWLWKEQHSIAQMAKASLAAHRLSPEQLKAGPRYARLKLMLEPESLLSPEERLKRTQIEFDRLADLAENGDEEARSLAVYVAEWLRDSAKRYYASSKPSHEILANVLDRLDRLQPANKRT